MEHFDIGFAIELAKHYAPIAKPVMSLVGTVLSARQNALTAAQLHEHSADIARLTEESNRTRDMIQSLAVALENYERDGILTEQLVHQQIADPELSQFVERAADASAASKLESKRHIFGRFVAKRLLAVEEDDIVLLRRGMNITSDLVETQLLAIAGIVMIQNLTKPSSPFPNRAKAEVFAKVHFADALDRFKNKPWSQSDLDTLGSVGALGGGLHGGVAMWGERGESSLDRWFRETGVTQDDLVGDPEVGTNAARARYALAYPTLHALSRLSIGHLFDETIVPIAQIDVNRIDTLDVTPVGFVIGQTILEQLAASDNS
jgi:hypothetical protein